MSQTAAPNSTPTPPLPPATAIITTSPSIPTDERHWTPSIIVGSMLSGGILALLGYELIFTSDVGIHNQIVSILSMGFGSAITYFLGNQTATRSRSNNDASINVEPPSNVTVNNPAQRPPQPNPQP